MKMKFLFVLLLMPLIGTTQEIDIDTKDASVSFNYISEKTTGSISDVSAKVKLNTTNSDDQSISGTAPVANLSTGNKMRDKHLRSKDYFNASEYPNMTFTSSVVKKDGENYVSTGTLTIKNTTKNVVFKVKKDGNNLVCTTMIYAADYDVAIKKDREKSKVEIVVTVPIN